MEDSPALRVPAKKMLTANFPTEGSSAPDISSTWVISVLVPYRLPLATAMMAPLMVKMSSAAMMESLRWIRKSFLVQPLP